MKAAEAKKLIGKVVTWKDSPCPKRGYLVREAKILDVSGRNVFIDSFGSTDWKWLPDMIDLMEKPNP